MTNTPTINDTLNDVTVLANGYLRVAWSSTISPVRTSMAARSAFRQATSFTTSADSSSRSITCDINIAAAGQLIPLKFSLGGNQGFAIFASGFPASSAIPCDASEPGVVIEESINAGNSSLSYYATNDQYSYVWKTEKPWKGTCRMLVVKFSDGTQHLAKFRFR